jgi:hypothetical protein
MEQLKIAWVYRFWIIIGIVALLPIVSYFIDTRKLSRNAKARADMLKSLEDTLQKQATMKNPNDNWVKGVSDLKEALSQQVDVAWIDLYKRQAELKTWPEVVSAIYLAAGPNGEDKVDTATRVNYQESYLPQLEGLFDIVQPVGRPRSKGLVEMDSGVIYSYRPPWADAGLNPPTVKQAWLAQEDIWLLRAALGVVAIANKDSTKWHDSPVKKIVEIEIGTSRARDGTIGAKSKVQMSPRGGYDAPTSTTGAAVASSGREGGEIRGPLYSEIPIYMKLVVHQPSIIPVLAAFGNCEIPMQVKEVHFSEIPIADRNAARLNMMLGDVAKKGAPAVQGTAPAQDDVFFQMAVLDVWARAIMYKKPPKIVEEEKKAAADKAATKPAAS